MMSMCLVLRRIIQCHTSISFAILDASQNVSKDYIPFGCHLQGLEYPTVSWPGIVTLKDPVIPPKCAAVKLAQNSPAR